MEIYNEEKGYFRKYFKFSFSKVSVIITGNLAENITGSLRDAKMDIQ
jgi:hypothetical protein